MADDLFDKAPVSSAESYDGSAIEVLEGLEPVRRRPGMYIGGTDERALHHLAAEVLDNAMDEAVAGHANRIEVTLEEEPGTAGRLTITDNGGGSYTASFTYDPSAGQALGFYDLYFEVTDGTDNAIDDYAHLSTLFLGEEEPAVGREGEGHRFLQAAGDHVHFRAFQRSLGPDLL